MKWLVSLYPRAWRRQYEKEFAQLLEEVDVSFITILDVVLGACDAHCQQWQRGRQLQSKTRIGIGAIVGTVGLLLLLGETAPTIVAISSHHFHTLEQTLALAIPIFGSIAMMLHLWLAITGLKLLREVRDNL